MDLKTYKFVVKSDLYIARYEIRAVDLKEGVKKAKIKFARSYKVFGDKVKVSLETKDLKNHIEEIVNNIYKGG